MINKIFFTIIGLLLSTQASLAADSGVLDYMDADDIRNGNIHVDDLTGIISWAIDFLMGFAGTIAIIFIIIGGYKIALGSLEQDKTKGKETIFMALSGFALAALSGVIIKLIIDNLT